jgi:hypothetical protein
MNLVTGPAEETSINRWNTGQWIAQIYFAQALFRSYRLPRRFRFAGFHTSGPENGPVVDRR